MIRFNYTTRLDMKTRIEDNFYHFCNLILTPFLSMVFFTRKINSSINDPKGVVFKTSCKEYRDVWFVN